MPQVNDISPSYRPRARYFFRVRGLVLAVFLYLVPTFVFAADFITTWKTDNPGTSANNQITIPTVGAGYNYRVIWGDGTVDFNVTGDITHTYPAPGTYTVRISGDFPRIYFLNRFDKDKILSVEQWGDIAWTNMLFAFFGCTNLVVNASDAPDLSGVTDLHSMFRDTDIGTPDFSGWDTSNITRTAFMFLDTPNFNGDITTWDMSNVTDMSGMFARAPVFNQAIGGWDVSSATNMAQMFQQATAFNQDLDPWGATTGSVTNMATMFFLAESFNQDIDNWDVSSVTSMRSMFQQATAFNGDIRNWNTGMVTDMSAMFFLAESFDQDIDGWDVSAVTTMHRMFLRASSFNQDLNSWDVTSVLTMQQMFQQAAAFNGDVTDWITTSVTNMDSLFYLSAFDQDIGDWDTSNVTDMSLMFARSPFNQDITGWDTGMVTQMDWMFWLNTNFNQEIGTWDTAMVTNMRIMFQQATAFNGDISGWDVGNVQNMQQMFWGATGFDQDLGSWDVTSVTEAVNMFHLVTLSTANYDSLLIGWNAQALNPNVRFSGGNSTYCLGEAARTNMIASDGWTITDAGLGCPQAAPTDIAIDGANTDSVNENSPVGTNIGVLTTVDPDAGDTHTYTLACATAGADDALFQISGNDLQTNTIFDFENPTDANSDGTYEVCIVTTDDGTPAESYEETITITINNERPDLQITKTVNDDEPVVGSVVTFTLTISNPGPDDATAVLVNDLVPAGFTYAGSISGGNSQDDTTPASGGGLEWVINSLPAGATPVTLTFTATVNAP